MKKIGQDAVKACDEAEVFRGADGEVFVDDADVFLRELAFVGADVFFHRRAVAKPAECRGICDGLDDDNVPAGLYVFADVFEAGAKIHVVEDKLDEDEVEGLFCEGEVGAVGDEKFHPVLDAVNAGAFFGEIDVFGGNIETGGVVAEAGKLDADFAVAASKVEDAGGLEFVDEAVGVFFAIRAEVFASAVAGDFLVGVSCDGAGRCCVAGLVG